MQSLNKGGVSITQTLREEKFVGYHLSTFKRQTFYRYDYRHTGMKLFSTVAKTLAKYHRRRDGWIAKKGQGNKWVLGT